MFVEYFTTTKNPHHAQLLEAITNLKTDTDKDVRYYAGLPPLTDLENHDTVSSEAVPYGEIAVNPYAAAGYFCQYKM